MDVRFFQARVAPEGEMKTLPICISLLVGAYLGCLLGAWAARSHRVDCGPFIIRANTPVGVYICAGQNTWHPVR